MEWEDVDHHEQEFEKMLEYTQKQLKLLKKWSWIMIAAIVLMILHSLVNLYTGSYGWLIMYSVIGLWNWYSLNLNAKSARKHQWNEIHLKRSLEVIRKMKDVKTEAENDGLDVSSPETLMKTVSTDNRHA